MTTIQADILDELYFVSSFKDLRTAVDLPEETLCQELEKLMAQDYVKCFFPDPDSEIPFDKETFATACRQYFYLATKKGLVAHNSL